MKNVGVFIVVYLARYAATVKWPFGTYTLVKPNTGCPPGWLEGWTKQDNEDSHNKNSISYGHHFFGSFGRNFQFYYCTRIANENSERRPWPAGNYCILKHGESCPAGFEEGSVYWDDEDSRNENGHGGTIPSGDFGRNTRIYYCCRKDGSYTREIQLPTEHLFYLLRFTSP